MSKMMARFDPVPDRSPDECERHYTEAHVPMAQNLLGAMPEVLSYHVNRAVWQADVGGGFRQRPRAWRFVVLRFVEGATLAFPPDVAEMVSRDHTNCLYRLRSCEVTETVALDRRNGNPSLAKFLIEVDGAADAGAASEAFARLADRVHDVMEAAPTARLLTVNRVLSEAETESVAFEGQRIVGIRAETDKVGYLECYFDHVRWGADALAALNAAGGPLRDPAFSVGNLMLVEELTALDRRAPSLAP